MANERLNIPYEIRVGYQNRKDTYSGKLAYVTYINKKNEIAKEKSWDSWRDKKIDIGIFKNEPTEGFVLNKRVGGYKSGWNFRQTKCRVYDPRGFEVEITLENLLYILQECTSTKGKGLEGKFVYAWDGKDLVLLPICCEDYKCSINLQNKKENIKIKDLKIGAAYKGTDSSYFIYLGKLDWYTWVINDKKLKYPYLSYDSRYYKSIENVKLCTFVDIENQVFYGYKKSDKLDYIIEENAITLDDVETYIEIYKTTLAYKTKNIEKLSIKYGSISEYSLDKNNFDTFYYQTPDSNNIIKVRKSKLDLYQNLTLNQFLEKNGWHSYSLCSNISYEKEMELREIFNKNCKTAFHFTEIGTITYEKNQLNESYYGGVREIKIPKENYKYLSYVNNYIFLTKENEFIELWTNYSLSSMKINFGNNKK